MVVYIRKEVQLGFVGERQTVVLHFLLDGREMTFFDERLLRRIFPRELNDRQVEVQDFEVRPSVSPFLQDEKANLNRIVVRLAVLKPNLDRLEHEAISIADALNLLIPVTDSQSAADGLALVDRLGGIDRSSAVIEVAKKWLATKIRDLGRAIDGNAHGWEKCAIAMFSERLARLEKLGQQNY